MVRPPIIEVANIGMWDSLILLVMGLVVFGPRRLPEIGRQIGKLMYEVRKASNDFKFEMEKELCLAEEADRRKKEEAQTALAQTEGVVSQAPESESGAPVIESTALTATAESSHSVEQVSAPQPDSLTPANETQAALTEAVSQNQEQLRHG